SIAYHRNDPSAILDSLHLATPKLRQGLSALKDPDYPVLTLSQIKAAITTSKTLVDVTDPTGDDNGTGAFEYPANPNFVRGSFDLTNFTVSFDDKNVYFYLKFQALSNPGWHPEYGFQLTYVAIAIDEDGVKDSGKRLVEQNANYMLDEQRAYEKLILVGGGVRLEDKSGNILAAYIPAGADISNPLGNAESGTISFALPLSYLGKPSSKWTFTILAGAQDDHGGAGLGEFRTVNREVGEWNGGGKTNPNDSNVYDVLIVPGK
ncbi:MAG: glucodextranase DOMON-like domain-containing protein, partial [Bacteroidota bacterium]